jgi:hypothetical protein
VQTPSKACAAGYMRSDAENLALNRYAVKRVFFRKNSLIHTYWPNIARPRVARYLTAAYFKRVTMMAFWSFQTYLERTIKNPNHLLRPNLFCRAQII